MNLVKQMSGKTRDKRLILVVTVKKIVCDESTARSLELTVPWRPLNPYQHQHLISFAHFDAANKQEIVQVAHHNAHILKKYKEINHHPVTSYNNPFQIYTQTPGPLAKLTSTTGFYTPQQTIYKPHHGITQNIIASSSNLVHAHQPYPSKQGPPYHAKVSIMGKPEMGTIIHQNTIHHTPSTTPKLMPYKKEKKPNVHIHYHPGFGISASTTTKKIPIFSQPITPSPYSTTKAHPVMNKLKAHMAIAQASQANQHKIKYIQQQKLEFSPPSQVMSSYTNFGPISPIIKDQNHYLKPNFLQHQSPLQFSFSNYHPPVNYPKPHTPYFQPSVGHPHQSSQSNEVISKFNYKPHQIDIPSDPPQSKKHHQQQHQSQSHYQVQHHQQQNQQHHDQHQQNQNHQHHNQQQQQNQNQQNNQQHQNQQQQNQNQYQLPNLHPSVLTPFLEQVQVLQKETSHHQRLQQQFQPHSQESQESSTENTSFEMINDIYSKNLVPPPFKSVNPTQVANSYNSIVSSTLRPSDTPPKPKFNLKMPSPLQDASIFSYTGGATPASSTTNAPKPSPSVKILEDFNRFKPIKVLDTNNNSPYSTSRPTGSGNINVFQHLNRPKDNVYKQHKQLHPSYGKVRPSATSIERPDPSEASKPHFLPTPYKPERDEPEEIRIPSSKPPRFEPTHSFFTVEDAVTRGPTRQPFKSSPAPTDPPAPFSEVFTFNSLKEYNVEQPTTIRPTLTPAPVSTSTEEQSTTVKTRQKLRRKRPRPQNQQKVKETQETEETLEEKLSQRVKPNRNRVSNYRESTTITSSPISATESDTTKPRTRPLRTRTRPQFTRTTTTASTVTELETTLKEEKEEPVTLSSEPEVKYTPPSSEGSDTEHVKHRVRLRYKVKLNTKPNQSLDIGEFNPKIKDSKADDTHLDNVIIKEDDEPTTITNSVTENSLNDIRSSLRLPNLKVNQKNEDFFTTPSSTTLQATEEESKHIFKPFNRPRFSIKDFKRKQASASTSSSSASTTSGTTTTSTTTSRPDSQRFNRIRFQLNKDRNETLREETYHTPKRNKYLTKYLTTSTTASPDEDTTVAPKRSTLPKRIFPYRNYTRYTPNHGDSEAKSTTRTTTTTTTTSRSPGINLRNRLENYKKKDNTDDHITNFLESNKNLNNLSSELLATTLPTTTSTETYKHETAIMKIAKSSSSHHPHGIRTTTSNFVKDNIENDLVDFDLAGSPSEHSQRVADLTVNGNNDKSSFKSVNINVNNGLLSRRIPNYFTISTDDPILPIQAFFPQIKTNENNH